MDKIISLKEDLVKSRPKDWKFLPDIDLYMDQILIFLESQIATFDKSSRLTSSMINNYVKDSLIEKPKSKKYSKEHLSRLTIISMIKQVLSVKSIKEIFKIQKESLSEEEIYSDFLQKLDSELLIINKRVPMEDKEKLNELIMEFAIKSYVNKFLCEKLLELVYKDEEN